TVRSSLGARHSWVTPLPLRSTTPGAGGGAGQAGSPSPSPSGPYSPGSASASRARAITQLVQAAGTPGQPRTFTVRRASPAPGASLLLESVVWVRPSELVLGAVVVEDEAEGPDAHVLHLRLQGQLQRGAPPPATLLSLLPQAIEVG
ncbi:hypothetical protein HaLaN_26431, partial [Haematococcus lacustris]